MTSQKSYNNLGKNVRDQLHKMRSAILLLGVLYLAAGPVWFLLQMTSYPKYSSLPLLSTLYVGYFHVFYFLALALGTVGGFYATRYQNVPQQSNFYHSLPVTRQGLLSARILALVLVQVLLLIVVTMVDVGVVLVTASHVSGALAANLVGAAGVNFCYIMLVFLLALAVSLFAGQLTANTIGQVLMTAVLHLSVPFVAAVFMGICSTFTSTVGNVGLLEHLTRFNILTGFMAMITSANDHINTLNPGLVTAENAANFAPQQLVWDPAVTILYVVLAVVLFVGAYVLYNRRAVEKAGDTLLYPMVGNVIKALYVFLGGVVCGLCFWILVAETMIGFVIGAVIAMVVVHLIAEMLYSMDVDGVRRHYISSVVGLAVALLLLARTGRLDLLHRRGCGFLNGMLVGMYPLFFIGYTTVGTLAFDRPDTPLLPLPRILTFMLNMILVGVAEELVFRGIIAQTLLERYGTARAGVWKACLVSGVLFGAAHLSNLLGSAPFGVLMQCVFAASLGVMLAAIYFRTGNLWVTVFLHSAMDIAAMLIGGLYGTTSVAESVSGYDASRLVSVAVYLIPTVFLLRKKKLPEVQLYWGGIVKN